MKGALVVVVLFAILLAPSEASAGGVVESTMRLNFSISTGDTVYIGTQADPGSGVRYPDNTTTRTACAQNVTFAAKPVSVTLATGGGFRNMNFTLGTTKAFFLTQDYGEPFYVFFTDANCTPAMRNARAIERGNVGILGSAPAVTVRGVLAWMPYNRINITKELRMPSGIWEVLVQNNGTARNTTRVEVALP